MASWNVIPGRFWVFSTSTAFEAQHVYRPWHVFAILECGGDFKEAARRLDKLGYGTPAKERVAKPTAPPGLTEEAKSVVITLPPIYAWEQEEAADWPRPAEIVQGVLYRGAKGMIAGPSKGRKTFLLSDLAVSVVGGVPWLAFPTTAVPVLYVNLELHLRNFPQQPPFVVRWKYPCWERAPEADPAALKGAKAGRGRRSFRPGPVLARPLPPAAGMRRPRRLDAGQNPSPQRLSRFPNTL